MLFGKRGRLGRLRHTSVYCTPFYLLSFCYGYVYIYIYHHVKETGIGGERDRERGNQQVEVKRRKRRRSWKKIIIGFILLQLFSDSLLSFSSFFFCWICEFYGSMKDKNIYPLTLCNVAENFVVHSFLAIFQISSSSTHMHILIVCCGWLYLRFLMYSGR